MQQKYWYVPSLHAPGELKEIGKEIKKHNI